MVKRFFDIVVASMGALFFLPFGIVIAIILRVTGEGQVFYTQKRIGLHGKPFFLFKFVTMLKNSPNLGAGEITVARDSRVLPVGRFLRKTKLNEVPQLLNILKGDMSIVGPRPLTPRNFKYYDVTSQEIITRMRPGLTGIGSIVFRDEERMIARSEKPTKKFYMEEIAPRKARLERWYYEHRGATTDLLIVLVTVWVVLFPGSALPEKVWKDLPCDTP